MKVRSITAGIIVAGVAVAVAVTAQAKVYQIVGAMFDRAVFDAERVGKTVYRTVMQINGGKADVTVVQARDGVEAFGRTLSSAGAAPQARFAGDRSLGLGIVDNGSQSLRLLALAPASPDRALVVAVAQSKQEERDSSASRAAHGIPDVPAYPGGAVTCFMRNADTRTCFETQKVPAASDAAASFYSTALVRNGWSALSPDRTAGGAALRVFAKGRDVCCVLVKASDWSGESVVTLLHKRGAVD